MKLNINKQTNKQTKKNKNVKFKNNYFFFLCKFIWFNNIFNKFCIV